MQSVRVALVALVVLVFTSACSGPSVAGFSGRPGPYDVLDGGDLELLVAARRAFDGGELDTAFVALDQLRERRPINIFAAALRQDVELQWLGLGRALPDIDRDLAAASQPTDGSPAVRLRRWYRSRTQSPDATAFDFVLAARVEDDEVSALRLLDRALELDEDCIWGHYARAFVFLRQGELADCRPALERAIELDASHPRVRRLEATLLEATSESRAARDLLAEWIVRVADDPRVSDAEVVDANLDIAHFDLAQRRPDEALARLIALKPTDPQRGARTQLLMSDAWAGLERWEESLQSARLARTLQSSSFLSWVQEAMILQDGLGDLEGALDAWRSAVEVASQRSAVETGAALTVQRARIEILRLEARLAQSDEP